MGKARSALWIEGQPDGDGDMRYFRVGRDLPFFGDSRITVSAITITADLPGPQGMLERARVYGGPVLIFEAPVHNLGGIGYA